MLQRKPIALIGLFGLFALFNIAINFVPLVGQVLSAGSLPLMSLGFMLAAHQVLQAQTPTASVFLQPLRLTPERRRAQLLLGLACALSLMAAGALSLLVDGGALLTLLEMRQSGQSDAAIEAAMAANPMLFFGGLLRMVLLMAVLVPFTLAPALIHWGGQGVMQSLFSSVLGLWRNKGAFVTYFAGWFAVAIGLSVLMQLLLALVRAERRLAAEDDHPFLVRVVGVKGPLLVPRLDLVHARADQLGVGVRADPGVLEAPALALFQQDARGFARQKLGISERGGDGLPTRAHLAQRLLGRGALQQQLLALAFVFFDLLLQRLHVCHALRFAAQPVAERVGVARRLRQGRQRQAQLERLALRICRELLTFA